MVNPRSVTLPHLSIGTFTQIQAVFQQMASQGEDAILITHHDRWAIEPQPVSNQRFSVMVSPSFSALLAGTQVEEWVTGAELTFVPEAIADFLLPLATPNLTDWGERLTQASQIPQTNCAALQTEFTRRLVEILATPAKPEGQASALAQQIEQERLLRQVTTQIRQSLDLPVILQTAVEQGRTCLQVDRLIIYQLQTPSQPTRGFVIHEARASEAIVSVLHLGEDLCFTQTPFPPDRFQSGKVIAVEDVIHAYAKNPCLLKFLQTVQVHAKLLVPIVVQDELWGFLIGHDCQRHRQWQPAEQQFLQHIGEHLAIAISQAQLYNQVHQQKTTLEERVIERTQALHDAMTAAQVASQLKGEFLATVSHELRTPLTCIIGMSATLLRWSAESQDRQRTFLQAIHNSGETLLELINNMLELSQFQTENALLDLGEFSLSLLVQQTLREFQPKAAMTQVDLKLDLQVSPNRDRVVADPRRVRQILANLLSNAIKFTPAGTVTLRAIADDSGILFQVKDTGIGIAEQQRSLLFQQFQQLDGSRQREYGGTGLGLALTKQLVEMHGGTIEVQSAIGVGSVFTVRLPQLRAIDSLPSTKPTLPTDLALGRIVLLANQDETAEVICDILTAAGYQLVWMIEGTNAVTQIELLQPLLLIIDAELSNGDCHEVLRSLRQNPVTSSLKTLALVTEHFVRTDLGQPSKVDRFLIKPIHPEAILLTVQTLRNKN